MEYTHSESNKFKREMKRLEKGNPKQLPQIKKLIEQIRKRIKGTKDQFSYKIGMKHRIKIEIQDNHIIFLDVGSRENFYLIENEEEYKTSHKPINNNLFKHPKYINLWKT